MSKRILSLLLAALMALSLCVPAFASGEPAAEAPAAEEITQVVPAEDITVLENVLVPEDDAAPSEASEELPAPEDVPQAEAQPVPFDPAPDGLVGPGAAPMDLPDPALTVDEVHVSGRFFQSYARAMLSLVNDFRTTGSWYWNEDNTTKTTVPSQKPLTYDYNLEQIAMKRAIEIVLLFGHDRPNGQRYTTLTYNGTASCGENIAKGYNSYQEAFIAWREDSQRYEGQGHRRNMLYSQYTAIGIACFVYRGNFYWVQEFGFTNSGAGYTPPLDNDPGETVLPKPEAPITEGDFGANNALHWEARLDGYRGGLFDRPVYTLFIGGIGDMPNYTKGQARPWEKLIQNIEALEIEDGVTSVGDYAFSGLPKLYQVIIAGSVTRIGSYAFAYANQYGDYLQSGCPIYSLELNEGLVTVGDYAFAGIRRIDDLYIPSTLRNFGDHSFLYTGSSTHYIMDGLETIGGRQYWFNDGMLTRDKIIKSGGKTYYAGADGQVLTNGWVEDGSGTCYAGPDGAFVTGLQQVSGGRYYYFDYNCHVVKNQWINTSDGNSYLAAEDGHLFRGGTKTVGGQTYYLSATDGHVLKNTWVLVNGVRKYYAGYNGALYTGYVTIGKNSYYFSVKDCHLMKGGIVTGPGNNKYYVSANDGHAMKGGWARGEAVKTRPGYSKYYFLDESGRMRVTKVLPTSTRVSGLAIPSPWEYQN